MRRPNLAAVLGCSAVAKSGLLFACICLVGSIAAAENPAYRPAQSITGEIRIWGSPADGGLIKDWENGFKKFHPEVQFSEKLYGPDSTMAGVTNGVAELALLAHEMRLPVESMAFEWVYRYKPFSVEVANAGSTTTRPAANLAVFVHKDNPIAQLSFKQLDGIFGAEHLRGKANLRSWGELGLSGAWKDRPVIAYAPAVDSIPALFFQKVVLKGSAKWNPALQEIAYDEENGSSKSDAQILEAVAHDPAAVAYAAPRASVDGVKMLPLSIDESGPFIALSAQSVAARTYPLGRVVTFVLARAPGDPIQARLKEFLRYVLSREGQAAVARDGAYIPLSAESIDKELKRLE